MSFQAMSWARKVVTEDDAVDAVSFAANLLAEAAPLVGQWGDGNCGYILDKVRSALLQSGHMVDTSVKVGAKDRITYSLRKQVFERDEYRCVACGTHIDLTVDHIKPRAKGGTNDLDNLQTLCRPCNSVKGDKL